MSVEFDEEVVATIHRPEHQSLLTKMVLTTGLTKTDKGVQQILLSVAIVSLVSAVLIFFEMGGVKPAPQPIPTAQWP